ncbi:MAG: YbjN domain-containing protein [Armatimonadota bacterium]
MATMDVQWLREALRAAGYEVTDVGDGSGVRANHPKRPNVIARVRDTLGIITFQHYWRRKKGLLRSDGAFRTAVGEANSKSWLSTFYIDHEGDLGVSSYIYITDGLQPGDIDRFLEKEAELFTNVAIASGLVAHLQ